MIKSQVKLSDIDQMECIDLSLEQNLRPNAVGKKDKSIKNIKSKKEIKQQLD